VIFFKFGFNKKKCKNVRLTFLNLIERAIAELKKQLIFSFYLLSGNAKLLMVWQALAS